MAACIARLPVFFFRVGLRFMFSRSSCIWFSRFCHSFSRSQRYLVHMGTWHGVRSILLGFVVSWVRFLIYLHWMLLVELASCVWGLCGMCCSLYENLFCISLTHAKVKPPTRYDLVEIVRLSVVHRQGCFL